VRNILVASDLSARSERAIGRANLIARDHSARLTVLHVVDEELPSDLARQMTVGAEAALKSVVARIPIDQVAITQIAVAAGEDWRTIVNEADARNSDLIVLGTHRMTNQGFLQGSTMERVIRATHRPVLVVRDEARGPYRTVLAAVDFSIASRHAVQAALTMAPEAEFYLLHAYQTPFPGFLPRKSSRDEVLRERRAMFGRMVEEEMASFLGAVGRQPQSIGRILKEGPAVQVIENEARSRKPDLLVLGTRGRTGAALTILGSVALTFLEYPPCDVLVGQAW
jgi:universal stress protein E